MKEGIMRFQNIYKANVDVDFDQTFRNLEFLGFKPAVGGAGESLILCKIMMDRVQVEISTKGTVVVAWADKREKIEGLKILQDALAPLEGKKGVVLEPLYQNVWHVPYPEPKEFRLIWCEEGTQYFSFDRYSQLMNDLDEITLDYVSRLDFDAAQRRADLLFSSDVLPQSWKKQLEPLFKDAAFKKAWKVEWVRVFLISLRNLIWKNSK